MRAKYLLTLISFILIVFAQNTKTLCLDKKREAGVFQCGTQSTFFLKQWTISVWGVPLMVLIMAGGIMLHSSSGASSDEKASSGTKVDGQNEEGGDGEITSFGALCTAA